MGKQKKSRSGSKSASKKVRLVHGSLGKGLLRDPSLESSRTSFKSAISRLKGADLNLYDLDCSSDDDLDAHHEGLVDDSECDDNQLMMDAHSPFDAGTSVGHSKIEGSSNLGLNLNIPPTQNGEAELCFTDIPSSGAQPKVGNRPASTTESQIHFGDFASPLHTGRPYLSRVSSSDYTHDAGIHLSSISLDRLKHHKVRLLDDHSSISIPSDIAHIGVSTWAASIVGYFLGGTKSIHYATYWVKRLWGDKVTKVFYKGNGFYIFSFSSESDLIPIVDLGHAYFGHELIILQQWKPNINMSKPALSKLPIWFKFYNVPLTLWHEDGIAILASHFGKPLYLDKATKLGNKLSYARVCVEVEVSTKIPSSINVQIAGCNAQTISIDMPWKPSKCMHCKGYGHSDSNCTSNRKSEAMKSNVKSGVISKFEWKVASTRKEISTSPTLEDSLASSNMEPAACIEKVHEPAASIGKVQVTPDKVDKPADSPKLKAATPGSSSEKRVQFDKFAVLMDKATLAKEDALSTISFPALKSCLKVTTGRPAMRPVEIEPP